MQPLDDISWDKLIYGRFFSSEKGLQVFDLSPIFFSSRKLKPKVRSDFGVCACEDKKIGEPKCFGEAESLTKSHSAALTHAVTNVRILSDNNLLTTANKVKKLNRGLL